MPGQDRGHVISGRVLDPAGLLPPDARLMLVIGDFASASSSAVTVAPDGSFVTRKVPPGTYALEIVRLATTALERARMFGLQIVRVGEQDVPNVTVRARPEANIQGRFRMESENRSARWPTHLVVSTLLVLDGEALPDGVGSEAGAGGTFRLPGAFGPRLLRVGYILAPGHYWWPSRVLLDGRDVTNVPTDFSEHDHAKLEVVFTQHPSWLTGTVTDAQGRPAAGAWVVVFADDPSLWRWWAATCDAVQANPRGEYSIPVRPGRYLLRALPRRTFSYRTEALRDLTRLALRAAPAEVAERQTTTLPLTVLPLDPLKPEP